MHRLGVAGINLCVARFTSLGMGWSAVPFAEGNRDCLACAQALKA